MNCYLLSVDEEAAELLASWHDRRLYIGPLTVGRGARIASLEPVADGPIQDLSRAEGKQDAEPVNCRPVSGSERAVVCVQLASAAATIAGLYALLSQGTKVTGGMLRAELDKARAQLDAAQAHGSGAR